MPYQNVYLLIVAGSGYSQPLIQHRGPNRSAGQGGAAVLSMSNLSFTGDGNNGSSNNSGGGGTSGASGGGGCDAGTPGVIALLAAAMIIRKKQ